MHESEQMFDTASIPALSSRKTRISPQQPTATCGIRRRRFCYSASVREA
jgi:hypothetical protein